MSAEPLKAPPVPPPSGSDEDEGGGAFTDPTQALPSLFADPDGRGARKWAQMFDPSRCEELDLSKLLGDLPKI